MLTLALFAALVPLVAWAVHRDIRRAVRRRELRARMVKCARQFEAFQSTIGAAMLPAFRKMVRAAADMETSMRKVQAAMNAKPPRP